MIEEAENPFATPSSPPKSLAEAFGSTTLQREEPPSPEPEPEAEEVPINSMPASSMIDLDISSGPPAGQSSAGQPARFEAAAAYTSPSGTNTAASPDLAVSVANPQKVGEGMSAYFTYEVTTKTSLPQYAFGQFSVTRRFRDFDWLHTQLQNKFPGAIVPPLPEKHSAQVATLKVTAVPHTVVWLEERRAALQRFLHSLVAHPMLHKAADLQAFLEKPDDALDAWKELAKAAKPSTYSAMMTDMKAGLLSSYGRASSLMYGETASSFTPLPDVPCQQMANYASALQAQVTAVHKHSKSYIERRKGLSNSLTGLGLALTQLSNCEAAINESLSRGFSHMGLCVGRLHATYAEQAEGEAAAFEEPMREYIRLLTAVKHAIGSREAALKAYNGASSSLQAKKERLDKLRSVGGKEEKVSALTREVAEAEEAVNLSKSEYEAVAARVDGEMARFQTEKLADFKKYVLAFVQLQIEYSEKVQQSWRELLPRLEDIDSAPGSNGAVSVD